MYSKSLAILLTILFALAHAPMLFAQTTVFDLGQIVVNTDPDDGANTDAPSIEEKSVISQKALKSHKIVEVAEIISDELIEASMIRKSGYGNEIGLRGFTKSNLRFTQDNTLIEGSCGSRKDPPLSHINMLTVQSLEVKEGPYDVSVPGALGGNINVITKNPQQGLHGELFSKFGSYGFLSQGGYATGGSESVQALAGYNYSAAGQYEDGGGNKLSSFNPGYNAKGKSMDAFEKHDVWAKLMVRPGEGQKIMFSSSYGLGRDIMTPRVGMDTKEEKTYLNKIEYTALNLGSLSEQLKISAYYNRVEHYPSGEFRATAVNDKKIEAISDITGTQIENQTITDVALFTYGADFYLRNWNGFIINRNTGAILNNNLFPNVDEHNVGVYVKAEKDFDKLSLSAGLRTDVFHTRANKPLPNSALMTSANSRTNVYPSVFVFGKYFVSETTNIFAGTGVTTRTPTAVERYTQQGPGFYGNPYLDPAHNFETDLGFETKAFERLTIRMKGFYSYINDYIYQTTIPAHTWTNIDASIYGTDINASLDIGCGLSLYAGMAYQRGRKLDQPAGNNDKDLAEIAPLKTKLAVNYEKGCLAAVLEWIHSDDSKDVDTDGGETPLDGWDVLNFRLNCQLSDLTGKMSFLNGASLNFGINNIFDKRYAVANSYEYDPTDPNGANALIVNEPGRFIYGNLTYRF